MVKYHGVLKQEDHGISTHLQYPTYEKTLSTTVYHVMSWYTMVYHVMPYNITKYHVIPWYIFIRDDNFIYCG